MRKVFWILVTGLVFWLSPGVTLAIVADHTSVEQFSNLSKSVIDRAASYRVLMMRASTGGYISHEGLGCLSGDHGDATYYPQECVTYANNRGGNRWPWYDWSNWSWRQWPEAMSDSIAKMDQFVSQVGALAGSYDVIGMKYCYVDGWNQSENVGWSPTAAGRPAGYYINKMLDLEARYPNKKFIWATSALWADPGEACGNNFNSCQGIWEFNQQLRSYAKANNKLLYDIADIESDGGSCQVGGYEGMCQRYYANGGGHPNAEGSIRLAKGFWWLIAMAGGGLPVSAAPTESLTRLGDGNGDGVVNIADFSIWMNDYLSGGIRGDFNRDGSTNMADFSVWLTEYTR